MAVGGCNTAADGLSRPAAEAYVRLEGEISCSQICGQGFGPASVDCRVVLLYLPRLIVHLPLLTDYCNVLTNTSRDAGSVIEMVRIPHLPSRKLAASGVDLASNDG